MPNIHEDREEQEKRQQQDTPQDAVADVQAQPEQPEVSDAADTADAADTDTRVEARIKQLEAELSEHKLRAMAEEQNIRRRASADVEKAHKYGQEKMIKELLPVVDSLEQALLSTKTQHEQSQEQNSTINSMIEGIELTLKMLTDGLAKFSIKVIDPEGQAFNPQEHEAMAMQPSDKVEPNTVLQVVQKGYKMHDRILRPARVLVAKTS